MIDESEARRRMPVIEGSGFTAIAISPGDVYIEEPASLIQAWLAALDLQQVEVRGHTPVTGIKVVNGEVTGVLTHDGEIDAPVVIDAAGAWARAVGELAGGHIRVCPVRHQLLISEPLAGVTPEHPIVRVIAGVPPPAAAMAAIRDGPVAR
jgi:glycine/D-amino acid oxidase-like deaminating enzyme